MMRSMYAGVSGLKNHQTKMDVIGNNIANVNTTGYKKSRAVFKDTLYQTIRGASRPTDARGGTNPMGVGLGMTLSSIDQIHTPAPAATTNKITDMAIDGNGYFVLESGGQKFYSRAGNFDFDKMGNLVNTSNGYKVHGWMADKTQFDPSGNWMIDTVKATQPIDISGFKTIEPSATTEIKFSGNLNSNLAVNNPPNNPENVIITSKEIYDSLGNKHTIYFRFYKTAENQVIDVNYVDDAGSTQTAQVKVNQWNCDVSFDPDFPAPSGGPPGDLTATQTIENVILFDSEGNYPTKVEVAGKKYQITGITTTGYIFPPVQPLTAVMTNGADNINFDVDFSRLTQWESKSTAWAEHQNGYSMGNLVSFTIGIDGTISGVYDNGETRNLARVALANFQNPAGLLQAGSNLFQVSNNSGDPLVGAPGDQGMGGILPGSLEMSNVDLSEEFTDMIVTQRGFQANSRIITTSDEMLQELVNLKR